MRTRYWLTAPHSPNRGVGIEIENRPDTCGEWLSKNIAESGGCGATSKFFLSVSISEIDKFSSHLVRPGVVGSATRVRHCSLRSVQYLLPIPRVSMADQRTRQHGYRQANRLGRTVCLSFYGTWNKGPSL